MDCKKKLFEYLASFKPTTGIGTWGMGAHRSNLYVLPVLLDAKIILELGTGLGISLLSFASAILETGGVVYSVDHDKGRHEMVKNDFKGVKGITFVLDDTIEYEKKWDGRKIDFLLCDSDHSYETVYGELTAWEKHLSEKAIIAIHDVNDPQTYRAGHDYSVQRNKSFLYLPYGGGHLALIF